MPFHKITKFIKSSSPVSWGVLIAILGILGVSAMKTEGQVSQQEIRISNLEGQMPPINEQLGHISGKVDEMDELLKVMNNRGK